MQMFAIKMLFPLQVVVYSFGDPPGYLGVPCMTPAGALRARIYLHVGQ